MLIVDKIKKSFSNKYIFKEISFKINKKEKISILGPNSSGKSTLLKILAGLVPWDEGNITLFNKDLSQISLLDKQSLYQKLGIAFQHGGLFDFMNVEENILFALKNMTDLKVSEMKDKIVDFLKRVNLNDVLHKFPGELSGGMRRRVCLIRALITKPQLLLLDDPTAGLDPVNTSLVLETIQKLTEEIQCALLLFTSNVEVAFSASSQVALIKDQGIIGPHTWDELIALQDEWITKFLTGRGYQPQSSVQKRKVSLK